jgi:hypothetical protein
MSQARNYFTTTFFIDLISSIPLDSIVVSLFSGNSDAALQARSIKLVRIIRILRLARLLRLLRASKLLFSVGSWLSLRPSITAFASLLFQVFFVAHWFGCLFAFVSETSGERNWWLPTKRHGKEAEFFDASANFSAGARYLAAIYFSITTATTTGYVLVNTRTNVSELNPTPPPSNPLKQVW